MGIKRYKKQTSKTRKNVNGETVELVNSSTPVTLSMPATTEVATTVSPVNQFSSKSYNLSNMKTAAPVKAIDYFGFPVKLIYSDLIKALIFSTLIFIFLFAVNRYFHV